MHSHEKDFLTNFKKKLNYWCDKYQQKTTDHIESMSKINFTYVDNEDILQIMENGVARVGFCEPKCHNLNLQNYLTNQFSNTYSVEITFKFTKDSFGKEICYIYFDGEKGTFVMLSLPDDRIIDLKTA